MTAALDLNLLNESVSKKYDFYEKRIVGIMMARYDRASVKKMIEDCHKNGYCSAGEELDIFWAGYGKGLEQDAQDDNKIILDFADNDDRLYFDADAFSSIKNKLNAKASEKGEDRVQIALVSYEKGKLDFHKYIFVDLEANLDTDYQMIQKIMGWLAKECNATHDVVSLTKNLKRSKTLDSLKGVLVSDALNISSHMAGAAV
jgi:hypothetical protein